MNESKNEIIQAIREEREAEKKLAACRRRVDELIGLTPENSQRRKKATRPEDFAKACGL